MAWIEVHQSLPSHRKTRKLARLLGFKLPGGIPQVVGHLVMLWLWCVDNATDGLLCDIDAQDVADAAGWSRSPDLFMQALGEAGYLDSDGRIHDWDDYFKRIATKADARKTGNRERQQRYRDRIKRDDALCNSVTPDDSSDDDNDTVTQDDNVTSRVTLVTHNGATVPNLTVPSITPIVPCDGDAAASPRPRDESAELFGVFWERYPRKTAKANALKAWRKIKPDKALAQTILLAVREQAKSPQWQRDDGQYIPHAATWLNARRWEDETTAANVSQTDATADNPYKQNLF